MSLLRQLTKAAMTTMLPSSWLLTHGPRERGGSEKIQIALTFDDGPHPEHTPRLLDALEAVKAKATFFVIGERAIQNPSLIKRIANSGHELGNHTWSHSDPAKTSATHFRHEVRKTRQLIQDLTGRDCRLMRPPLGKLTLPKMFQLWQEQQTIVLWNTDPKDFAMTDSQQVHGWLDHYLPCGGDIVLLHDNHSHATLAVERLTAATDSPMKFVTISSWQQTNVAIIAPRDEPDSQTALMNDRLVTRSDDGYLLKQKGF